MAGKVKSSKLLLPTVNELMLTGCIGNEAISQLTGINGKDRRLILKRATSVHEET